MRPFLKIFIGCEFGNNEQLKKLDHFIIVSNHNSHVDTMAILSNLPLKHIHNVMPVAAKDYFGRNIYTTLLSKIFINVLLIERNFDRSNKSNSIHTMEKKLEKKISLIIFPEGSRGKNIELQEFKSGVVKVLLNFPDIAFIPTYISSSEMVLPKGDAMVVPHNFKITFGTPQFIDRNLNESENLEKMKQKILELA